MKKFFIKERGKNVFRKNLSQKELEEYIKETKILRDEFDLTENQIIITDPDANVVYANKAVEKNTRFPAGEIIGKNPADLWGGKMPRKFYEKMWQTIKFEKRPFFGRVKNKRKNGVEYWQELYILPVFDNEGNTKFFIGIEPRPVKANKQSSAGKESALLSYIVKSILIESHDLNSALNIALRSLCASTDWTSGEAWVPDTDNKYLELNSAWYNMPQLETFINASREFKFPQGVGLPGRVWKSKRNELVMNISSARKSFFMRSDIARQNGIKSAFASSVILDGKVIAIIVLFKLKSQKQDKRFVNLISEVCRRIGIFTQQKEIERALKKSQEKMETDKIDFASLAGHQLKNPLTSVRWSIESFLRQKNLTSEQKDMLDKIYKGNELLINLTNDLVIISRIESAEIGKETADIAEIISQIIDNKKKEKPDKIFIFHKEIASLPLNINKTLATQLFTNIISNGSEYSAKQNGEIEVALNRISNDCIFSCKDNGSSIPQEDQSKIFSKFFRASNAADSKETGTGLGLFIAKKICDGFGWKISFESPCKNDRGTIFYVKIPLI